MLVLLTKICRDEKGATAVEYGLIAALIVITIMTSMSAVANENTGLWAKVTTRVLSVMQPAAS